MSDRRHRPDNAAAEPAGRRWLVIAVVALVVTVVVTVIGAVTHAGGG